MLKKPAGTFVLSTFVSCISAAPTFHTAPSEYHKGTEQLLSAAWWTRGTNRRVSVILPNALLNVKSLYKLQNHSSLLKHITQRTWNMHRRHRAFPRAREILLLGGLNPLPDCHNTCFLLKAVTSEPKRRPIPELQINCWYNKAQDTGFSAQTGFLCIFPSMSLTPAPSSRCTRLAARATSHRLPQLRNTYPERRSH